MKENFVHVVPTTLIVVKTLAFRNKRPSLQFNVKPVYEEKLKDKTASALPADTAELAVAELSMAGAR